MPPTTWKDLAKVEEPYEHLEVDPARWDPIGTQVRMEACANALLDLYRQLGEGQKKILELGVRSGPEYKTLRGEQIILESKEKALEKKWHTLRSRSYIKKQEENVS